MPVQAREADLHQGEDLQLPPLNQEDADHPLTVAPPEANTPTIESADTREAEVIRARGDPEDTNLIDRTTTEEGDHHPGLRLVDITTEKGTITAEEGTGVRRRVTVLIGIDAETIEESQGGLIVMKETDIKDVGPDLDELTKVYSIIFLIN